MEISVMNSMCRCCASEGAFKDIKSTYHWMGEDEVYGDMLKECFDITLTLPEVGECGICEVCITQLRNAVNFKKQVLHTEDQFRKQVQNKFFKPNIVKVEVPTDDVLESDDNNLSADDAFSGLEYEVPIKNEASEETAKAKKPASAKASTSRAKKHKLGDNDYVPPSRAGRNRPPNKNDKGHVESLELDAPKNKSLTKVHKHDKKEVKEILKHRHNVKTTLQCSNATPIHSFGSTEYSCYYCSEQFSKAFDLKKHILENHDEKERISYMQNSTMKTFRARLDITSLNCSLCGHSTDNLELLMDHLTKLHDKKIYKDIKNHIIVFKFEDDNIKCVFCSQVMGTLKRMREHLNIHYRNYVCDDCGAGFVNREHLSIHLNTHKLGTFKCEQCEKVFDTHMKKKSHEKSVHLLSHLLLKCSYCGEKFRNNQRKSDHLVKVHGLQPRTFKCGACDKTYKSPNSLNTHTKRDHLLERKHKCTKCDMKFFQNIQLRQHMVKHTGSKDFKCQVCTKSFGRNQTLTEHMRMHNNDRRFKCDHCGQAFVQKCSWKAHVKNKHGESV